MFDITLASARVSLQANDLQNLEERYPELDFVFAKLARLQDHEADSVEASEFNDLKSDFNLITEKASDIRAELERAIGNVEAVLEACKGLDTMDTADLNEAVDCLRVASGTADDIANF